MRTVPRSRRLLCLVGLLASAVMLGDGGVPGQAVGLLMAALVLALSLGAARVISRRTGARQPGFLVLLFTVEIVVALAGLLGFVLFADTSDLRLAPIALMAPPILLLPAAAGSTWFAAAWVRVRQPGTQEHDDSLGAVPAEQQSNEA